MKHRLLRKRTLKRELSVIIARNHFEGVLVTVNDVDVAADLKSAQVL
jgi:ribosome-binding factor A